eukprot:sb/3472517/
MLARGGLKNPNLTIIQVNYLWNSGLTSASGSNAVWKSVEISENNVVNTVSSSIEPFCKEQNLLDLGCVGLVSIRPFQRYQNGFCISSGTGDILVSKTMTFYPKNQKIFSGSAVASPDLFKFSIEKSVYVISRDQKFLAPPLSKLRLHAWPTKILKKMLKTNDKSK